MIAGKLAEIADIGPEVESIVSRLVKKGRIGSALICSLIDVYLSVLITCSLIRVYLSVVICSASVTVVCTTSSSRIITCGRCVSLPESVELPSPL